MRNQFGEGSTPVLYRNTLVIVWDHIAGPSFVVALDKRSGRELWRAPRQEIDTWATPLVVDVNGRPQAIVPGMTGRPHYQVQRLSELPEVFSSPVGAGGRVYITGRDGTTLVIRHGPPFEVLAKNMLDDGSDASPALVDKTIYMRGYQYLYAIAAP